MRPACRDSRVRPLRGCSSNCRVRAGTGAAAGRVSACSASATASCTDPTFRRAWASCRTPDAFRCTRPAGPLGWNSHGCRPSTVSGRDLCVRWRRRCAGSTPNSAAAVRNPTADLHWGCAGAANNSESYPALRRVSLWPQQLGNHRRSAAGSRQRRAPNWWSLRRSGRPSAAWLPPSGLPAPSPSWPTRIGNAALCLPAARVVTSSTHFHLNQFVALHFTYQVKLDVKFNPPIRRLDWQSNYGWIDYYHPAVSERSNWDIGWWISLEWTTVMAISTPDPFRTPRWRSTVVSWCSLRREEQGNSGVSCKFQVWMSPIEFRNFFPRCFKISKSFNEPLEFLMRYFRAIQSWNGCW